MKVLFIIESLIRGGKERRLIELLRSFEQSNYKVCFTLILLKDELRYPEIHRLKNTKLIILKRKRKKSFSTFIKLFKHVKIDRPDIIQSWGGMSSVYVAPIALMLRIPFVNAMITNSYCPRYSKTWIRSRMTFPFSNIILSNSIAGLNAYKVRGNKKVVIHNGFNFDRLNVIENIVDFKNKYGIKTKYVISMVAAFYPRKDYNTFFESAEKIVQKKEDVSFIAAGEGILFDELYSKYNSDRIIFTGKLNHIETLLHITDIGVLLSNPDAHGEGISNSILETMAFGKPIIASDNGGNNEIIIDKETGFILPSNDVKMLCSKIEYLLNNQYIRMKMGELSKKRIHEYFSTDKLAHEYYKLYKNLTK